MKKIQFLLLIFILFLTPSVFASDYKLNSHISATSGGTKNRYGGLENYNYGSYGTYTFGTRYQGRLGNIETYIDYPFEANTTYTLTYNMNTDDFINHFGSSYWWDCSQVMTNSNATVQSVNYISYKKVKFTFTPTSNTTCIYVSIRSTNPNTSSITQITNWQLDSIYLYDPDYQGSGSGGSGGTPTPTPTSDPNQVIIDNNNQNTNDIISSIQETTQQVSETITDVFTNKCGNLFNKDAVLSNVFIGVDNTNSTLFESDYAYTTPWIEVEPSTTYIMSGTDYNRNRWQFKSSSGVITYHQSTNGVITTSSDTKYFRTYFYFGDTSPTFSDVIINKGSSPINYCAFGSAESNKIDNINDSITNDNVDSGTGSSFFSDFEDEDFGLSSIITIPLNTIQSLTSQSCVALNVPIPFTNSSVSLPCMTQVYQDNIPTIYNLWKIVSFGIIAYFIAIDIFHMVKGFKDPESDKVEVLDL